MTIEFHTSTSTSLSGAVSCLHCKELFVPCDENPSDFCCPGCQGVYHVIHHLGLQSFYPMRDGDPQFLSHPVPKIGDIEQINLDHWDDQEFQESFCDAVDKETKEATFFIEGLSCYACVWLCEKAIAAQFSEVSCRIDFARQLAFIRFRPKTQSLSPIVQSLQRLGYSLHAYGQEDKSSHRQIKGDLIRLATAFLCASQIMIFSLADYFADGYVERAIRPLFLSVSFGFATISLFYGAKSYLQAIPNSWRSKSLSLDLPIAFAFLSTYLYSVWNIGQWVLYESEGGVYFDSLSMIIFLLLGGRFWQKRMLEANHRELNRNLLNGSRGDCGDFLRVSKDGVIKAIPLRKIKAGDVFYLRPQEILPIPAQLKEPAHAQITSEPSTGESKSFPVSAQEVIPSGIKNGQDTLLLQAKEDGLHCDWIKNQRYLNQLYLSKGRYAAWVDRISSIFLLAMLILGGGVLVWWGPHSPQEALDRFIGVMIVACPCVFSLSLPLVFGLTFSRGLEKGVIFKNQRAVEKLTQAKYLYFDKTGTLTQGPSFDGSSEDQPLSGVKEDLAFLREKGYELVMLTGDHPLEAQRMGLSMGFRKEDIFAELTPETKARIIQQQIQPSVMIGNGLNDALSLTKALIGVAVSDALPTVKQQADIVLTQPGIHGLITAMDLSQKARKTIFQAFTVSLLYNMASLSLALNGTLSPLVAAILMPINSFLVISISRRVK